MQMKVMEHQKTAAKLSQAEDARSLVGYSTGYGVISTLSKSLDGYPSGSVVGFAPDEKGLPVFCFISSAPASRQSSGLRVAPHRGGSSSGLEIQVPRMAPGTDSEVWSLSEGSDDSF